MAFDGITIHSLTRQLSHELIGGFIRKIAQPEPYELLFTIKAPTGSQRLLLSANASLPLIYLTQENKTAPMTAPNFCMLLRKHIGNGQIVDISQIENERVIRISIEHRDELGDKGIKFLYVEIMGKHSNIVFCSDDNKILDGIKHVSFTTSSVREILPGRDYFIPSQEGKTDPYKETEEPFVNWIKSAHTKTFLALSSHYTGISKVSASEIAYRAGLDPSDHTDSLPLTAILSLWEEFHLLLSHVDLAVEKPCIVTEPTTGAPIEFAPFRLSIYEDKDIHDYEDMSSVLAEYYGNKNRYQNIHQKSSDLRRLVSTMLERNQKKYHIQQKQMDDTAKMSRFKTYGTLLQIYPNDVVQGTKEVILTDFETNEPVRIPLDPQKNAIENASHYFEKYGKLKRTKEALSTLLEETKTAILHLSSIQNSLAIAENEADLMQIRQELFESGYIKKRSRKKGQKQEKSLPLHYVTEDGFHIYVGKNNYQNDELTFKLATGNDWWFHAKQIPGSHVIIRTEGKELPDEHFITCAQIAGYYSQGRENEKLEIDYVKKKHVKKPAGAVPGFVVYYTNYSMTIHPGLPLTVTLVK